MASILDRYGIKEVADVVFYKIGETGAPERPVLYLDTLKVSTIEQAAEESEARGGKGNAALIAWDFGKDINVTLEDALFSAKSLSVMFGNGTVANYNGDEAYIMRTEVFSATKAAASLPNEAQAAGWNPNFITPKGGTCAKVNPKFYDEHGEAVTALEEGKKYFCSYDLKVAGQVIDVSADTFPGTYYITGDTFARSETTGDDEFFQFIIPKAKVTSENTLTMEADGDPSVFNMNLKVLRPADGKMMRLVKYSLEGVTGEEGDADAVALNAELYHNHILDKDNMSDLTQSSTEGQNL